MLSPLSYGELVLLGVDGRGRTCTLRLRTPVPSPLGHVDSSCAPPTRFEPVAFCSTGSCSGPAELRRRVCVCALGLEPSLIRGKSPVPYLSGVARVVRGHVEMTPTTMLYSFQIATVRNSRFGAYGQARKVSNPRPSVLETAAPPLARAQEMQRA